jgi:hypothetical protein
MRMRRLVLVLTLLFVFAGCDDTVDAGGSGGEAAESSIKLKPCKVGGPQGEESAKPTAPASQNFGGIELSTNGDVVGFVEDEQCRVSIGYVESPESLDELEEGLAKRAFEREIPLSTFDMISDTQQFFLNNAARPYTGDYAAKLLVKEVEDVDKNETGEGQSSPPYAIMELSSYREGRQISKTIFRDISAPLGARLQLTFPASLAESAREEDLRSINLLIDNNGDLSVDETLPPTSVVVGPASGETDPPRTSATVQKGRQAGEVLVKLTSDDAPDPESGSGTMKSSGVAQIFYAVKPPGEKLDAAATREYENPFSVPLGSTVYYYSVDRAGNFDTSHQIVADTASIGTTTSEPMGVQPSGPR